MSPAVVYLVPLRIREGAALIWHQRSSLRLKSESKLLPGSANAVIKAQEFHARDILLLVCLTQLSRDRCQGAEQAVRFVVGASSEE